LHPSAERVKPAAIEAVPVNKPYAIFVASALAAVAIIPIARPAQADTGSTAAIALAAGAIVGALLTDSNNQPYYVNNGQHVYVNRNTATYYRAHGNNRNRGQNQGQYRGQNQGQYANRDQRGGQQGH
jgi:hypothetical protein